MHMRTEGGIFHCKNLNLQSLYSFNYQEYQSAPPTLWGIYLFNDCELKGVLILDLRCRWWAKYHSIESLIWKHRILTFVCLICQFCTSNWPILYVLFAKYFAEFSYKVFWFILTENLCLFLLHFQTTYATRLINHL